MINSFLDLEQRRGCEMNSEGKMIKIKEDLSGHWTLNWQRVLTEIQQVDLTDKQRQDLITLTVGYVERVFRNGTFGNLDGIQPILDHLGMDSLEITPEWLECIFTFYAKYPLHFLYQMSPTLYNGRLYNGTPYDRIQYTRALLEKREGTSPTELTDAHIQTLWNIREILVQLHYFARERRISFDPSQLITTSNKLPSLVRLLTS